jgi:hypothetical protein
MSAVDQNLLNEDRMFEGSLFLAASRYRAAQDLRWMFARAHYLITQQINTMMLIQPAAFRNPNELLRFNMCFASAFLAAVAGNPSYPWKKAFFECKVAEVQQTFSEFTPELWSIAPVIRIEATLECSIAMANAHINTDIANALRSVGCIDPHDYGNILLFVERGSRVAIIELTGVVAGPVFDYLKEHLLPLDKIWRNAIYERTCSSPVPDIEPSFEVTVDQNIQRMLQPAPSTH